jgi:glycosyltransferase involved in cell wall biosynthesis
MSSPTPLHVHALVDDLGCGGAQLVLADFAELAPLVALRLTVGHLRETEDDAALVRLRRVGVEPEPVGATSLIGVADILRVRRHLARVRPALVHTHLKYADVLGGIAARSLGIPVVSTLHEAAWSGTRRHNAQQRVAAGVRRLCADRLIAVSAAARSSYVSTGWERPDRVATVYNGIVDRDSGDGAATRARLGLGPGDVVVAMVSALRPEKGHDVALGAVAMLRHRVPRLRLVIVGDGARRAQIERAASELGSCAVIAGYQSDVPAILAASDVLLHPSYIEAFPTALLQAMAASVPVVATAVGGIPEILADGTGVLIPPPPDAERIAARLEPLLGDPVLRRRLGEAGRARFRARFSADSWLRGTRAVYEDVLAAHRRRTRPAAGQRRAGAAASSSS